MFTHSQVFKFVLGLVVAGTFVGAHGAQNSLEAQVGNKKTKFALLSLWSSQSTLHEPDGVDYQVSSRLTLVPSYALTKTINLSAIGGATITHTNVEEVTMNNTLFRLSRRAMKLNHDWSFVPIVGLVAPTNEIDRIKNSFQASLRLEPTFLGKLNLFDQNIDLVLVARFIKNFHKFDRVADLSLGNNEYSTSQSLLLSYNMTDKFFIDLNFFYGMSWTYQQAFNSAFSIGQSLNYVWNKKTILSLGHSSAGNALDATGGNTDIRVFDRDRSVAFFRWRWSL